VTTEPRKKNLAKERDETLHNTFENGGESPPKGNFAGPCKTLPQLQEERRGGRIGKFEKRKLLRKRMKKKHKNDKNGKRLRRRESGSFSRNVRGGWKKRKKGEKR